MLVRRGERARRPGRVRARGSRTISAFPWDFRAGARRPRLRAGAEVRRPDRHRAGREPARRATGSRMRWTTGSASGFRRATVIIATGAEYRRLPLENLAQFEGAGVYYGATFIEAQLCGGEEVIVVGGGNSAGQAAVFLAQTARQRAHGGSIERTGGDDVALSDPAHRGEPGDRAAHAARRSSALEGERPAGARHAGATRETGTEEIARHPARLRDDRGAPNTGWLDGCLALDANGFIKTGPDLSRDDLTRYGGRSHVRRTCSRRACRVSSRLATCAAATSSGSPQRSAKARSRSSFVHQVLRE